MTYSYNPKNLGERGLDLMRFELGDTLVAEPEKTAYLGDEEILAAIESTSSWKRAKLRLVSSLLHRFSYEVDTKIKEAEWKLSQRVDEWEALYKRLKAEVEEEELSEGGGALSVGIKKVPPFFVRNMHDNRAGWRFWRR